MPAPPTTYADVQSAELQLQEAQESYLRRFGWTCTCQTPGSYWLWRRDFAVEDAEAARIHSERKLPSKPAVYGVVTTTMDLALSMTQRTLDRDDEHDGEGE